MSDREEEQEQEQQRKRPRVVDKRISARPPGEAAPAADAQVPTPAAAQTPAQAAPSSSPTEPEAMGPPDEPGAGPGSPPPPGGQVWTPQQEEAARQLAEEMARAPALDWLANAATQLVNVAAIKIETGQMTDAQLVIDALAAMVEQLGTRLADLQQPLRQALSQLQLMFAQRASAPPASPNAPGPAGSSPLG